MLEDASPTSGLYFFLQVLGILYVVVLVYFCLQHVVLWSREQARVRRAVAIFRVLALVTFGTTVYLLYYMNTGRAGLWPSGGTYSWGPSSSWTSDENPDLAASTVSEATVETTFFSKLTKLFVMCALILLASYRVIRRL